MSQRRQRHGKIVATLGPASASPETIRALFLAGVDVSRLNFSHGSHEQHRERRAQIRQIEREDGRPIGVLADTQGPKLRVGTFAAGPVVLSAGSSFRRDLDDKPATRRAPACRTRRSSRRQSPVPVSAGVPFGTPGATNLLRIAQI